MKSHCLLAFALIGCLGEPNASTGTEYTVTEQHCFNEGVEVCELTLAYCTEPDDADWEIDKVYACGSISLRDGTAGGSYSAMLDGWISAGCDEFDMGQFNFSPPHAAESYCERENEPDTPGDTG